MRLIASSLIVVAGAILYGSSATATRDVAVDGAGPILLAAGVIIFLIEYIRSWRGNDVGPSDGKKTP